MSWHKIWLVLRREYLFNFRRPSFLFTAFGVPALSLVAMFVIFQFTSNRESNLDSFRRIGYIDEAGAVIAPVTDTTVDYYGYQPVTSPDLTQPAAEDQAALKTYYDDLQAYATQQAVDKQLDAFFVIGADYTLTGNIELYSEKNIPQALRTNIEDFMRFEVSSHAPGDMSVPVSRLGVLL